MPKLIKYFFIIFFLIPIFFIVLTVITLQFGLETEKFNDLFIKQAKNYNENLNLDIKKIKIYLNINELTNPKIEVRTEDPILILGEKKVELKSIKTKIGVLSYFKDKFIIENFTILTRDNKISDLISIAALQKPSIIIYNAFLKEGYANVYASINFDENGKIIKSNFTGKIKDTKIKFNEKYNFKNINFDFSYNIKKTVIENASLDYKTLKFLSDQIYIPRLALDGTVLVQGDVRNEKTSINSNLLINLFENDLNFIKDQEITLETKNKFSFKLQKGKIRELAYSSKVYFDNLNLSPELNSLKNYFSNYNNSILLKNNSIKLDYENKNLNIEGESDYSFDSSYDKINYQINIKNNNYDFQTLINFDWNPITIKSINYSKDKNKKSNLKINGSYNKNKVKFNEINYSEGKNFFEVVDLDLSKDLKIVNFNKVKADYLNENDKKNEFIIEKDINHYNLSGAYFDSYNLINDVLHSDNDKSILDNFKINDKTELNIFLNKVFLDKENFSEDLLGKVIFKNNKVHNLTLSSKFKNNHKFKLDVKTLNNKEKITSFYSDNAEPFVKHYKFIKGFQNGKIDFYSVKKNNTSKSRLNIFDFKVKEMPALTKLLSLASLQGIADLMTGEGIRFNEFEMNFNNKSKLMTIDEIHAIGPAISILMSGYIESEKLVSLRGTLVPATTLNKIVGSLPLIGNILVGKKVGEGVFGVSFKIKGPPKDLKTTVNPIKTLTPRFITRTLEKAKKQK